MYNQKTKITKESMFILSHSHIKILLQRHTYELSSTKI